MHIRTRGRKFELIRPVYIKERQRCVDTVVARMQLYSPVLTEEIEAILTAAELTTVRTWLDKRTAEQAELVVKSRVATAASNMQLIASAINGVPLTVDQARAIVDGLDAIKKALRSKGFTKIQFSARK